MTNEELKEIVEFLRELSNKFKELTSSTNIFIGYLLGKEIKRRSRDSSTEEPMKYQKTQIKQRKDGRWYARYRLLPGKYQDIYGRTQLECYNKLKEFANNKTEINKKIKLLNAPPVQEKKTTFGAFFETWMKQEKEPNCKASTIYTTRNKYKNYLSKLADRPIKEITANEIREILGNIESNSTRSRCQTILSDIFKSAVNYELIDSSIMSKVSKFRYRAKALEPLTKDEEKRFIRHAAQSKDAILFFLMLFEGLRTSEAKAICPSDIKEDYIIVNKSIDDFGNFIPTKTYNTRNVPIFAEFKPLAEKYRGENKEPCLGKVNKHTGVKEYREICKKANIDKRMYSLRHTFATRCEEAGISVKQTAKWMGHSNIQTTLNNYIGLPGEFEKENIIKKDLHKF